MLYYCLGDIMKNKSVTILMALGLLLLVSGGILFVINGFKGEKEDLTRSMNIIVDDYETFRTKVEKFSNLRENIYNDVMNSQYYTDVYTNYVMNIQKLKEYESVVTEVDNASNSLKKSCIGKNFNDKDVINKCNAFIINYEQSINYFINDIARFNTRIKEYNTWLTTQGNTASKYNSLNEYNSKYKDYVDVNSDKIFSGKAEL